MALRKSEIIIIGIIVLSFLVTACLYHKIPDVMATHWNARGEVDGYMNKGLGLFIAPIITAVVALIMMLIPKVSFPQIGPTKTAYEKFRRYYDGFVILICVFMLFMQYFMILWNFGIKLNINIWLSFWIGSIFLYSGVMCEHAESSWPSRWPLSLISNGAVRDKINKITGKLFKAAGVVVFVGGILCQSYFLLFVLGTAILITAFASIYTYIEYRKERA